MTPRDERLRRAIRLHHELERLRKLARGLSYEDLRRWNYSIREQEITRELQDLTADERNS